MKVNHCVGRAGRGESPDVYHHAGSVAESTTKDDLIDKLMRFIADYDTTAKPFAWTYTGDPLKTTTTRGTYARPHWCILHTIGYEWHWRSSVHRHRLNQPEYSHHRSSLIELLEHLIGWLKSLVTLGISKTESIDQPVFTAKVDNDQPRPHAIGQGRDPVGGRHRDNTAAEDRLIDAAWRGVASRD